MKNNPKSRSSDIVVQSFEKEILIYDLQINKAYCLIETPAGDGVNQSCIC